MKRIKHWDNIAVKIDRDRLPGKYYHKRIRQIYKSLVPAGASVLEIGCGKGDLLSALKPREGVGIDFSAEMISQAKEKYPSINFQCADAHTFEFDGTFDYIILSDLINDVWDVQQVFENLKRNCYPRTRIIINYYSRLWQSFLNISQMFQLAITPLEQSWLTNQDVQNLLEITGQEPLRFWHEVLFPLRVPGIDNLFNKFLVKLWPISSLGLSNFVISRPDPVTRIETEKPMVSVIIPARNEADNIPDIFHRVPELGAGTELIFVEGNSKDNTYEVIQKNISKYPERKCLLLRQDGLGKGDAVRKGFRHASGDILMILDADLTVAPEDLPHFLRTLVTGKGEFINGVRLVYPMDEQAMRFFNLLGNRFFSIAFSWILSQSVKDSLCGTKVLYKSDYEKIEANRKYFGDFDPFGDFDLLFGAAKLNLKITDFPIRYRERAFGETNIQRWKHGWLLLRMVVFSLHKIKFI